VGLYSYDVASGSEKAEVPGKGFDLKTLTAGRMFWPTKNLAPSPVQSKTKEDTTVKINVKGDFLEVRPQFKELAQYVDSAGISPAETGLRSPPAGS